MVEIDGICFDHGRVNLAFSAREMLVCGAFRCTRLCPLDPTDPYHHRPSCRLWMRLVARSPPRPRRDVFGETRQSRCQSDLLPFRPWRV